MDARIKQEGFKKYAVNTSFLFLERIIRAVSMIVFWVFVIRYLGPSQFGILSYALSFVYLFSLLVDLGMRDIAVREIVSNPGQENKILGSAFIIKLCGALLTTILIILLVNLAEFEPLTKVIIIILSLQFSLRPLEVIEYYFQSEVLGKFLVGARVFQMVFTSILYILFVYLKLPLLAFVWGMLIEYLCLSVGLLLSYCFVHKNIADWGFSEIFIKRLLRDSWPLLLSGVAASVLLRIDQVMIKQMLDVTQVGIYSVAARLTEAFYFIPIIITQSLLPAIINAKAVSQQRYDSRIQDMLSLLFLIAIFVGVFMSIFVRPILKICFGAEFLPAQPVVMVYVWSSLFIFLGLGSRKWIINENLQIFAMLATFIGAVANIILNYMMIPRYGIIGAAYATILSYAFPSMIGYALFKKTRPLFILQIKSLNLYNFLNHYQMFISEWRNSREKRNV